MILTAMDSKTWLVGVAFPACAVAMATIAFTLMVGNALWKRMAGLTLHTAKAAPILPWTCNEEFL